MSTPVDGGHRRIDRVLDPAFVAGLADLTLEEVRSRRQEADQEEVDLSYLRRMLQGRADIADAELGRRDTPGSATPAAAGETNTGSADRDASMPAGAGEASEREVVSRLTAALTDETHDRAPAQGLGRHRAVEPSRVGETRRQGESLLATSGMADQTTLDADQLRQQLQELAAQEQEVSALRRQVQSVLDVLSAEITRRYRDGSASVDSLLGS